MGDRLISADALEYELGISDRDIYCKEIIADAPTVDAIPVDWLQACIKIAELFGDEHNEKLLQTLINLWHRDGYGFFEKRTKED